jgi:putative membrane protein
MTRTFAFLVGILMVGFAGYCAGRFGFDSVPAWTSVFGVVVLALPSFVICFRSFGPKRSAALLGGLGLFALIIEGVGVATGYPYGSFNYSEGMGWKVAGLVPWTVAFAWTPLLFTAVSAVLYFLPAKDSTGVIVRRSLMVAVLLVLMDLVLDPGAVATGLWAFASPGRYYGVPWTNFAGWLLSGYVGAFLFHKALPSGQMRLPLGLLISGSFSLVFWTGVVAAMGFVIPTLLGSALTIFFFITYLDPLKTRTRLNIYGNT